MPTMQQIETLLKGNQTFSHLNFSMMLMRLRMLYANDSSPSMLKTCADEISSFLEKFKTTMGEDFVAIQKL